MKTSILRKKVVEEINQIPNEKLAEILDLIHHFRLGLQSTDKNKTTLMDFSGCWNDMPEEVYQDFMHDITERRHTAFSGRENREAGIG